MIQIKKEKLKKLKGYFEETIEAVDEVTATVTSNYKKRICKNFISIAPSQIDLKISGEQYFVTRKLDGEMNVLFFNGDDAFLINTGGKVRMGIPCIKEAGLALKNCGILSARIPVELYVSEKNGRTRVFDVLSALSKEDQLDNVCVAPFDIIELDEKPFHGDNFDETYTKLSEIFSQTERAKPVPYKKLASKSELKDLFTEWVETQNAEGLIVRSELPSVFKLKPKHNIDVVVIGYTEASGESKGQIRTLLLALMNSENCYQVVGKTGNGFTEEEKKDFYNRLSKLHVQSQYIETDSNHVAFHMVKPEVVIEISVTDIIVENSTSTIKNHVLELYEDTEKAHNDEFSPYTYKLLTSQAPGISFIFPMYERIREDKTACKEDVRFSQVSDLVYIPESDSCTQSSVLPPSEVLLREVYKKESKDKIMVIKFVVWKTNKELIDKNYPAYVMHFTDFSSGRKDPLKKEVRVSNNKEQIMSLVQSFMEDNIKKGWVKVG